MEQTFKRTISGHLLQFNRLLYPVRYVIKLDDDGSNGESATIIKENSNDWKVDAKSNSPEWLAETVTDIIADIKENENSQ